MAELRIRHNTTYRYREPVTLLPHRLMLRPRESRSLRVLVSELDIAPEATVTWANDVFGNAVATATFRDDADTLSIDSRFTLQLHAAPLQVQDFDVAQWAAAYPFRYADDEWTDLGALTAQQYPDPDGQLRAWAQGFVHSCPTGTLPLLEDLSTGVASAIAYASRDVEGTQAPLETLARGRGACRDFAVLFADAARSLGFGARIASGYLFNPHGDLAGGRSSTHAWAEVYVPGAGWITFDPTNRSVGESNLIPVAVARDITQVVPVAGEFVGMTDAFIGMSVELSVTA